MNRRILRSLVIIILLSLFLSSCKPVLTLTPGLTPTSTSGLAELTPTSTQQPFISIDKLIDSNQAVMPFNPTDVFMFALPDWNNPEGVDVAKKLHATIIGSCHQDLDWRLQKWLDNAGLMSKVTAIAHSVGMKYTAHFTVDRDNKDGTIPFDQEVAVRDIDGNIINMSMPNEDTQRIWKSVHYPQWKEYMVKLAEKAVDNGVDILCIDGWTYNYDVIDWGGDFSANSLTGFKEYITNKYSAEQLSSFGIGDINIFDYRNFKKSTPSDPLANDFEDYQLSSSKAFWRDIISETKAYANSKGKTVLFTVNVNISSWETVPGLPIADSVDGFMSEYRFQLPPYTNTLTDFKIFRSLQKSVVLIPNAGASTDFLKRSDLGNLMKIYTAEAFASGEFVYPPYSILANGPKGWQFFNADINSLYPYYDFLTSNKNLYENLKSSADIAVFLSYASLNPKYNDNSYDNFYGISNLLLDIHRQFDVLFAGDNVWLSDTLTMEQLNQYQVIILPNVTDLSDKQIDLLLGYVKGGGKIFAFGETGIRNELGQPREDNNIKELLVDGIHQLGNGQFEYSQMKLGEQYSSNKKTEIRQTVDESLNQLNKANILTNANEKVSIIEYWNTNLAASIIHLINQDYDTLAKHNNQQQGISMEITLNKQLLDKDLGVFYLSPDAKGTMELEYKLTDGMISFTVPELETYGVLFIGDKSSFAFKQGDK